MAMSWIAVVLAAIDLAGIFFNVWMLLRCFRSDTKCAFAHTYKPMLICQFIYQVSMLVVNTIEACYVVDGLHEESYPVFIVLATCVHILLVSNLTALMVATTLHSGYQTCELSPKLLLLAPVCMQFVCLSLWIYRCLFHELDSQMIVINVFLVALLLSLLVSLNKSTQLDQGTKKHKAPFLWDTLKEHKKASLVITGLIMCCGTLVGQETLSSPEEFDKKIICLLSMNFLVGICLPIAFNCLLESICKEENENENGVTFVIH